MKLSILFCLICIPALADLTAGQRAFLKGDYAAALSEFLPLAREGNPDAQAYVGAMYNDGKGVPQNYRKAAKWYRRAAERGDCIAQRRLGLMYHVGQGVPEDYIQALMWYILATAGGDVQGGHFRDAIAKTMTPAQTAEAQRLAREWKPKSLESHLSVRSIHAGNQPSVPSFPEP